MHSPCLQILYVCVRVHVFVSFLKRVSKLAKPNPTRASTSLLHEAFSKKILEKFTVVIASWLDCRQLGFTITQKQNHTKNFLVFLNSEEAGLWNAVSVHMKEHPPLSRTRVEERIERNTNETTLLSHRRHTNAQDSCVFRTFFNLLNDHPRELHVLHWNFMLMMCVWKVLNGDSRVSTTSWPIIDVGSATNLAKSQAGL